MYESVVSLQTILLYALTEGLGMLCFSARSSYSRLLIFSVLLGLIYFQLYHTKIELNGFSTQYGIGCRFGTIICITFECVFKKDVLREFRWVGDKKRASGHGSSGSVNGNGSNGVQNGNGAGHVSDALGNEANITAAPFRERFLWGVSLYCNPRGIGWAHEEPRTLPSRPSSWTTRGGFLRSQGLYLLACWFVHDANLTLMRRNPYFTLDLSIPNDTSMTLRALWLLHRGVGEGLLVATGLILNVDSFGALCVALGLTDLAGYRPIFGSIFYAYTVRNVWSKTWHQFFRRPFLIITDSIADLLHLPKRRKLRAYFIITGVFTVSCLMHAMGDFVLVGSWKDTRTWTFFMPQVVAIWFENIAMTLGRKAGIRRSPMTIMLGYTWVLFWFAIISGPMTESHARAGYYTDRLEISIVDGLLTGQWSHYPSIKFRKLY